MQFEYSISVLPITVAALMTPKWLQRHLVIPAAATRVILPGYLQDHIAEIASAYETRIECGPRDIRDLPQYFGGNPRDQDTYGQHSIEIIAEINHAPKLSIEELLQQAQQLVNDGADTIDLGCTPGYEWGQVSEAVKRLCDAGIRVSIDSFNPREVAAACSAGAQLVLSVNSSNRQAAPDWGCEVVVIPDVPDDKKVSRIYKFFVTSQRTNPLGPNSRTHRFWFCGQPAATTRGAVRIFQMHP
ncbi:MAG: dihydropteroate synthase [Pirellulaceae bacterium]